MKDIQLQWRKIDKNILFKDKDVGKNLKNFLLNFYTLTHKVLFELNFCIT